MLTLLIKFTALKYYFFHFCIPNSYDPMYQYRFHEKQKAANYLFIYTYMSYINKIISVTIITLYREKSYYFTKKKLLSK